MKLHAILAGSALLSASLPAQEDLPPLPLPDDLDPTVYEAIEADLLARSEQALDALRAEDAEAFAGVISSDEDLRATIATYNETGTRPIPAEAAKEMLASAENNRETLQQYFAAIRTWLEDNHGAQLEAADGLEAVPLRVLFEAIGDELDGLIEPEEEGRVVELEETPLIWQTDDGALVAISLGDGAWVGDRMVAGVMRLNDELAFVPVGGSMEEVDLEDFLDENAEPEPESEVIKETTD